MKKIERNKQIHIRVTDEEHMIIMRYALENRISAQRLFLDALASYIAKRAKEK